MCMRTAVLALALLLPLSAAAEDGGPDVTMPLVEKTLRFLRDTALSPPSDAALLRAGALRICGEDLSAPGCDAPGLVEPAAGASGPDAARAWRRVLESALAGAILEGDGDFDKTAFQRYVMDAMVEALEDPASFYVLPSVYREIASISSDFEGFGFRVGYAKDCLRAVAVHAGSPAAEAGLLHGERITAVNGKPVTGYHRPIALAAIWGAEGDEIRLTLQREGGGSRELTLRYRPWSFEPYSVRYSGDALVLRVRYFGEGLADALRRELSGPCACRAIVLDLRDASAGDGDEMAALADLLLAEQPLGSKELRDEIGRRAWAAADGTPCERTDLPLLAVVNSGTTGLSEVLAAGLREADRALLLGARTAGLDTLETLRPFPDGSAVQVTSTRLLGPGRSDLSEGVEPHVATARAAVVELALEIVSSCAGSSLEDLLASAREALAER
ncbi:MAG: S41 family peptidase [Polyangia bacterium]